MSNLEVKKRNCVYKRVSFDRDWPEQYYNQNNRSRRSYRRSFSDDKGYRSGSFPDGSTPISRRSRLSESDSTVDSSQSKGKRRILRTTRSDAELVNKDFLAQRKRSHWDVLNEKLNEGGIDKSSETKNKWDFLQGKIQFVGVLRHMMSKDLVESRKQRLAKQKQDAAKVS
ncbi:EP400 [Mytilus coruscus]|uniref:EP400 n=1 Tax=Mytilus coruscus TaxID=42192 RepID=A0A6J8DQM2_MYTCO|nr:EP400 [Mytilus coruscus]